MDIDLLVVSGGVCFVAVCVQIPPLFLKALSLIVVIVTAVQLRITLVRKKKHALAVRKCLLSGKIPPPHLPATSHPVTTQKVDNLLTEVISLSLRDFVFSWFTAPLVDKTHKVSDVATSLAWQIVYLTQMRLNEVDFTTLLSQDIMIKLHVHFKTLRESSDNFRFKEYMDVEHKAGQCCVDMTCHAVEEKRFLKRVSIVLLMTITPRSIWMSPLFTEVMGDVLSNYVLYPLILKISDPYYVYQCILPYISNIGSPMRDKKFFSQAKTYEDFIKKINKETDLDKLRQLRYKVIAEIMQAMTIENLKQEEDFDGLLSQINSKSYRLSTRNLARYINQCKVAKVTCEKRIHDVTRAQRRVPHYADMRFKDSETKLLELDEILNSPYVLPFFVQYLEKQNDFGPLKLWLLIEQCIRVEKRPEELYNLIKQGYLDHLTVNSPFKAHQVSRHLIRMAEAYVEKKSEYWQFIYEIQEEIYTMLSEQHYKPFLISSQYMQYVCTTEGRRGTLSPERVTSTDHDMTSLSTSLSRQTSDEFSKLQSLKDELKSKEMLLETLDIMNYCSVEELGQLREEIQNLGVTINQLEHHSDRMKIWWESIGQWEVIVNNVISDDEVATETLYTLSVCKKKQSCQQIYEFSNKSRFKLTQFNLESSSCDQGTPQSSAAASLSCICSRPRKRRYRSSLDRKKQGSASSASTICESGADQEQDQPQQEVELVPNEEDPLVKSSYESLYFEQSYRSLRPHSILGSAEPDTISTDSLMFTPVEPANLPTRFKSRDSEASLPSVQEEDHYQIGNSVFYRQSSSDQSSLFYGDIVSDQVSVSSETTLRSLSRDPCDDQSDTFSLKEPPPSLPDSDEATLSVCSDDIPDDFEFDDIFNLDRDEDPEDTPSTKVRRYLSFYSFLDRGQVTSNQSDDAKLARLSTPRTPSSLSTATSISLIEEEEELSDSSVEELDPYLVVDIQSLSSQSPAAELTNRRLFSDQDTQVNPNCGLHGSEDQDNNPERLPEPDSVQTGWIITPSLDKIRSLYLQLRGYKSAGYPSSFPVVIPKDETQLHASKEHVMDFLNFVLRDKTLSHSEDVYRFFNPSCEQLYRSTHCKQKSSELIEDKTKDSIAIPFYTLLGEIFEIHGHLQWLRRQIIYLVRITFGSTIERQIYRAMTWAGSEQQVFWYLQSFRTSMWGTHAAPLITDTLKLEEIRGRVRISLLNTPPHLLIVLFGASKTRKGLAKMLDLMEKPEHGRLFWFTVIELVMLHLIETDPDRLLIEGLKFRRTSKASTI